MWRGGGEASIQAAGSWSEGGRRRVVSRSGIKEVEGGSRILIGVREEEAGSNRRKERRWLLEEANEEEERGRERDRECCRGGTWLEIQIRGTACAMHPLIYTRGASSEDCHHMSPLLNGSTPTQLRCFGDCYCDFVFSSAAPGGSLGCRFLHARY